MLIFLNNMEAQLQLFPFQKILFFFTVHEEIVLHGSGSTRPSVKDIDRCGWLFLIFGITALDKNQPSQLCGPQSHGKGDDCEQAIMVSVSCPLALLAGMLVLPRQGGQLGWEEAAEGSPGVWVRRPQLGPS